GNVVTGPVTSVVNDIPVFDNTTGNVIADSGVPITAIIAPIVPRAYFSGLIESNDGGTPNSVLDMAAGMAADTTNAVLISVGAFTKSTAGAWTAGTGQHGMGNGLTIANSTWYHVCLANNSGTPDYWFD